MTFAANVLTVVAGIPKSKILTYREVGNIIYDSGADVVKRKKPR